MMKMDAFLEDMQRNDLAPLWEIYEQLVIDEPNRAARQRVALNWAEYVLWPDWRNRLLRQRVSQWTGIDPRKPITAVQVRDAAKMLGKSENEIHRAYEKIATTFPLTLSWKPTASAGGQRASDAT